MKRTILAAVAATALVLTGSACGMNSATSGQTTTTSATSAEVNPHDAMFAAMMIPHHEQAIEMSDLVPSRSDNRQLKDLAQQIKDAQGPEIETMSGWLKEWGMSTMGMDHSGHGMAGMMTDDDMQELEGLTGEAFDRKWLTMMIEHHEGAITMARRVKDSGSDERVRTLADQIITGQEKEITTMKGMLAS